LEKFNVTLDCFCGEIPTSGPLGTVLGGVRENRPPQKCPFPWGYLDRI